MRLRGRSGRRHLVYRNGFGSLSAKDASAARMKRLISNPCPLPVLRGSVWEWCVSASAAAITTMLCLPGAANACLTTADRCISFAERPRSAAAVLRGWSPASAGLRRWFCRMRPGIMWIRSRSRRDAAHRELLQSKRDRSGHVRAASSMPTMTAGPGRTPAPARPTGSTDQPALRHAVRGNRGIITDVPR